MSVFVSLLRSISESGGCVYGEFVRRFISSLPSMPQMKEVWNFDVWFRRESDLTQWVRSNHKYCDDFRIMDKDGYIYSIGFIIPYEVCRHKMNVVVSNSFPDDGFDVNTLSAVMEGDKYKVSSEHSTFSVDDISHRINSKIVTRTIHDQHALHATSTKFEGWKVVDEFGLSVDALSHRVMLPESNLTDLLYRVSRYNGRVYGSSLRDVAMKKDISNHVQVCFSSQRHLNFFIEDHTGGYPEMKKNGKDKITCTYNNNERITLFYSVGVISLRYYDDPFSGYVSMDRGEYVLTCHSHKSDIDPSVVDMVAFPARLSNKNLLIIIYWATQVGGRMYGRCVKELMDDKGIITTPIQFWFPSSDSLVRFTYSMSLPDVYTVMGVDGRIICDRKELQVLRYDLRYIISDTTPVDKEYPKYLEITVVNNQHYPLIHNINTIDMK
jgi:hypothetical protein